MAKHTTTDGDERLAAAREKRALELEEMRKADAEMAEVFPETWQQRDLGFPPYLVMAVGKKFRVRVLDRDDRDEFYDQETGEVRPFVRYHLQLIAPAQIECQRGPNDDRKEPVIVRAGQVFTIGEYTQLANEFRSLLGLECAILCKKERKFKDRLTSDPRRQFEFVCAVSEETDQLLLAESHEQQTLLREAYKEARLLARKNSVLFPSEGSKRQIVRTPREAQA